MRKIQWWFVVNMFLRYVNFVCIGWLIAYWFISNTLQTFTLKYAFAFYSGGYMSILTVSLQFLTIFLPVYIITERRANEQENAGYRTE